jgi:hypothetical protein
LLQELIDHRDAVSLADRSHKLLIRVEESLLREIACPIEPPDRAFPYPQFSALADGAESHPGQVALALLKVLGPDAVIRTKKGAYSVQELVEGERYKGSHSRALAAIRRCVRRAGGTPGTCRREIGSPNLDQAWFIELMARDLDLRRLPLNTAWVDEDGYILSLLDFVRAEALLLDRGHRPGEPWFLSEYGVHALNATAVVLALFAEPGAIPPEERERLTSPVERRWAQLLELALDDSTVPVLYRLMLAGHLLECSLALDTFEPCVAGPDLDLVESCSPGEPRERLVDVIGRILRQSGGDGLPLGALSHALPGVRMLEAELPRSQGGCVGARLRAAPSAHPRRP